MGLDLGATSPVTELRPYERLPRRPWFLAPPRGVRGDLNASELILQTIQTREAYETLRAGGTLVGDSTRGEWHDEQEFREAYDWMRRQMSARLGTTSDGILWFWAKTNRRDLIRNAEHSRGEVLLTARISPQRVLLSHFDDWHAVLNRSLEVPLRPGETYEQWSPRFDSIRDAFDPRAESYRNAPIEEWPSALREELESSWDSIFNLAHRDEPHCVRATVHELHAHQIVRAVRII